MTAPLPPNEDQRLKALYDYGMLDSDAEQDYDLTQLASKICECPIALIVMVDKQRQWFKSRVGLAATETHRDHAFCAHAILEPNQPMIIPDATSDRRFAANPLVTGDPQIRFYAGMPLTTGEGEALGTLCVIDRKPRNLSVDQLAALRVLGRQAMILMELKHVSRTLALALSESKVMEGLLSICSSCKSIRDENGQWQQIESYLEQRTSAGFTYEICPTCASRPSA